MPALSASLGWNSFLGLRHFWNYNSFYLQCVSNAATEDVLWNRGNVAEACCLFSALDRKSPVQTNLGIFLRQPAVHFSVHFFISKKKGDWMMNNSEMLLHLFKHLSFLCVCNAGFQAQIGEIHHQEQYCHSVLVPRYTWEACHRVSQRCPSPQMFHFLLYNSMVSVYKLCTSIHVTMGYLWVTQNV